MAWERLEMGSVWQRLAFGWVPQWEHRGLASGLPGPVTQSACVSVPESG